MPLQLHMHIMPCAKAMLYFAAFVTGLIIAYLLFSLVSNFCVLWSASVDGAPPSHHTLAGFLYFAAYIQIIGLALLSVYEMAIVYMLNFLYKLERTQETALLRLKNNPPLRMKNVLVQE